MRTKLDYAQAVSSGAERIYGEEGDDVEECIFCCVISMPHKLVEHRDSCVVRDARIELGQCPHGFRYFCANMCLSTKLRS
jgi:hypothetical protein